MSLLIVANIMIVVGSGMIAIHPVVEKMKEVKAQKRIGEGNSSPKSHGNR